MSLKNRLMLCGVAMLMGLAGNAMGQDKAAAPAKALEKVVDHAKKAADDGKAEMEAWTASAKPGPMHKWLEQFAGTWESETTEFSPAGAGKPEKGKMEYKLTMGGRFIQMDFEGRMHGQFYHGGGMMGFNNVDQRFEATWADSMSSTIMYMNGAADKEGKVLTLQGEYTNPMTKTKDTFKEVTTVIDKDHHKSEFFGTIDGKETKMMEISYTRVAKGAKAAAEDKAEKLKETADKAKDAASPKKDPK